MDVTLCANVMRWLSLGRAATIWTQRWRDSLAADDATSVVERAREPLAVEWLQQIADRVQLERANRVRIVGGDEYHRRHLVLADGFDEKLLAALTGSNQIAWPLPPSFEVLSCGPRVLLLESPEPVPWLRIDLLVHAGETALETTLVWNADRTRAFVVAATPFPAEELVLEFRHRTADQPELASLTRAGVAVDESVRLPLES